MITIDDLKNIKFYSYPQPYSFENKFEIKCLYNGVTHFYSKKLGVKEIYRNDQELKDMLIEGLLEQLNREHP